MASVRFYIVGHYKKHWSAQSTHIVCRCYSQLCTLALPLLCLPFHPGHVQLLLCRGLMLYLTFPFLSSSYFCWCMTIPDLSLLEFSLRWISWCTNCLITVGFWKLDTVVAIVPVKLAVSLLQAATLHYTVSVFVPGFSKCAAIFCHMYKLTV